MLHVIYDPNNGEAIADSKMEQDALDTYARSKIYKYIPHSKKYSNEAMIDVYRALIVEGKIDHKEILLKWNGHTVELNKDAYPIAGTTWPVGFYNHRDSLIDRIILLNTSSIHVE